MIHGELQRAGLSPVANEELADWRIRGDADADALVERLHAAHDTNWLEDLLTDLIHWHPGTQLLRSPPAEDFLRSNDALPHWLQDWRRVERGQALYRRFMRTAMLTLGCASLPHCYAHAEVAGTLIMSGQLASQVRRRIGETANFLHDVMQQGALQARGDGVLWIRKVRLIHAVMRALIMHPNAAYLGRVDGRVSDILLKRDWPYHDRRPIDQLEMTFVLLTFSLVVVDGWRSLGLKVTGRDAQDYLYAWAVIGHMLGIHERLLCRCLTESDAHDLFRALRTLQGDNPSAEAIEAGRLLAAALLVLLKERVVTRMADRVTWLPGWSRRYFRTLPNSLIRRLAGAETAAALDLDPAPHFSRFIHWCLVAGNAFAKRTTGKLGGQPTESDVCAGFGEGIQQEFCARGPHLRPPPP